MSKRFLTTFAGRSTLRPCSDGSIRSHISRRCKKRCGISPIFILISSSVVIEENKVMANTKYNLIEIDNGVPIKAWTKGVKLEDEAKKQLLNVAQFPFVYKWVAAMPDVHWGLGATIGSVIPTKGAIIPAAVGVDIGCFTGDTLIPLLDGKSYQISELAKSEKEIIVYSCTESG